MNRLRVILLLAAFVVTGEAAAQDLSSDVRVSWLKQHAVRVRTLDPADEDFQDLQPLKNVIGDARIVMLGEISHGDGSTLLAKSRLVKFLHRQMDFDVLVFESPFYDMARVWESIRLGNDPAGAVRRGMMPAWSYSPQVSDLIGYVGRSAKSARPLELAGFDLQPGFISRDRLLTDLDGYAAPRNARSIDPNIDPAEPRRPYTTMKTMGGEVTRRIGSRAFMLGFTSFEGANAFGDPNEVVPVRKDQHPSIELEELFNAARFDYAVVDFRKPAADGPVKTEVLPHAKCRKVAFS